MSLGDVIYETTSNLTLSGAHNGEPWLNSPSVTLSGPAATLNGDPNGTAVANTCRNNTTWATQAQLKVLAVNGAGGILSFQLLQAGSYTVLPANPVSVADATTPVSYEQLRDIAAEAEKEAKTTGRNKVVTRVVAAPPLV